MTPLIPHKKTIEEALKFVSGGPFSLDDLEKAREVMTDEFCQLHGRCDRAPVLDWLDSLDDDQREDLLFEVNTDWSAAQDPWALGSG